MDKNYSAKKYFIYGFKKYLVNENRILAKRIMPSLCEVLNDYIEIFDDINNSDQEKLLRARNDLLSSLKFFVKDNILFNHGRYSKEFKLLTKEIDKVLNNKDNEKEIQYRKIYNISTALIKKLCKDNIYYLLVMKVKETTNFIEIDKIIETMISELLYDGYSLKYLDNWYNKKIGSLKKDIDTIDIILERFEELENEKKSFKYYVTLLDKENHLKEIVYLKDNLKLIKNSFENISMIDESTGKDLKNYLTNSKNHKLYEVNVEAMDEYKGLEVLVEDYKSYFQMINYLLEDKGVTMEPRILVKKLNGLYEKLHIDSYDDHILFSNIENRERQDIQDFINYRDRIYSSSISSDEISNIQRALNIVKIQKDESKENRLINLWSNLEYILTFHHGNSIISKVKSIIPKVVCLYAIKDNINVFWSRLYKLKDSGFDIVDEFIRECKIKDDDYYYDLNKLITFIQSKGSNIINEFDFNDVLKRNIADIGEIFNNAEKRKKFIKRKHDQIEYDLARIYRARNNLIHSSNREISNINHKSLRLYQYNENLLGLIIYYKNKNPHSTITEILNSISYTYDEYLSLLGDEKAELIDICKPKYFFIG